MPIRKGKGRTKSGYASKAYRAYKAAWSRECTILALSHDVYTTAARPGFMSRLLGNVPSKKDPIPFPVMPELRPYVRHGFYPVPDGWPKSFRLTTKELVLANEAHRHAKITQPTDFV